MIKISITHNGTTYTIVKDISEVESIVNSCIDYHSDYKYKINFIFYKMLCSQYKEIHPSDSTIYFNGMSMNDEIMTADDISSYFKQLFREAKLKQIGI